MRRIAGILLTSLSLTASLAHAQDIKIGGLLETSGFLAGMGQPGTEGAMLAIEEANKAGGIDGRKIDFVNINTETDNTKSVSAMRRLIEQEKVTAIIGPMSSGSVLAIVDAIERSKIPMIGNAAARNVLLPPERRTFTFLAPLTDVVVQIALLKDLQARGIKRIAVLHSDVAFGVNAATELEAAAPKHGIEILMKEVFGNADTDITPQLTKIRASSAEATVVMAAGAGLAIATKNHRALGIKTPLYVSHAANDFNYLRLAGDAAEGVLLPSSKLYVADSLPDSDPQKRVVSDFVSAYTAKYGRPPATFAGNGYDAARMIMAAIRKVGTDPAKLRAAIENTKDYVGVTAVYSYSPTDHLGTRPETVVMLSVKNGKFTLVERR